MPQFSFTMMRMGIDGQGLWHRVADRLAVDIPVVHAEPVAAADVAGIRTTWWADDAGWYIDHGPMETALAIANWERMPANGPAGHPLLPALVAIPGDARMLDALIHPDWEWPLPNGHAVRHGDVSWVIPGGRFAELNARRRQPEDVVRERPPSRVGIEKIFGRLLFTDGVEDRVEQLAKVMSAADGRLMMRAHAPFLVLDPAAVGKRVTSLTLSHAIPREGRAVAVFDLFNAARALAAVRAVADMAGVEPVLSNEIFPIGGRGPYSYAVLGTWRRLAGVVLTASQTAIASFSGDMDVVLERLREMEAAAASDASHGERMAKWLAAWERLQDMGAVPAYSRGGDQAANRVAVLDAVLRFAVQGQDALPVATKLERDVAEYPTPFMADIDLVIREVGKVVSAGGPEIVASWERLRRHADDPNEVLSCLEDILDMAVDGRFRNANTERRWKGEVRRWMIGLARELRTWGPPAELASR